jgi:predicted nucleotidyltransferase
MDTEELIKLLKEHKVDFVIIGATAMPVYGYARATLDIDIFIRPERVNAERTLQALTAFGYDMSDVSVDDLMSKKLLIRQYGVETDIHPFVKETTFEKVWDKKVKATLGKISAFFASIDDLIEMKEAAGRPQDLQDVKYLKELKNKTRRGNS